MFDLALLAIYTVFFMGVGFVLGVITKEHIDKEAYRDIVADNRKLHRENVNLKKRDPVETIHIYTENTAKPKSLFDPF